MNNSNRNHQIFISSKGDEKRRRRRLSAARSVLDIYDSERGVQAVCNEAETHEMRFHDKVGRRLESCCFVIDQHQHEGSLVNAVADFVVLRRNTRS